MHTFPVPPPPDACIGSMNGRITTMTLERQGGKALKVASMYVPVQPRERLQFLARLEKKNCLQSVDIVGMDANCVADVRIDTRRADPGKNPYANAHASKLEDILAHLGVRDVFRMMHGRLASGFTRECKSIATRIDRIYSKVGGDLEWLSIRANATFNQVTCPSDHRAVDATLQFGVPPQRQKGEKRIRKHEYHRREVREAIQQLVGAILDRYPRNRYGWEEVHELIKRETKQLVLSMSQPTGKIGLATILAQTVQKISSQSTTPSAEREECIKRVTDKWRSACRDRKEVRGAAAHSRIEAEEMCTKKFHARFKQKGKKTTIQEIYPMTGTQITPGAQAVATTEEIVEQAAGYYTRH